MEIRIWNSFACNNSSSYRLVAKFKDANAAATAAADLTELFAAHAKEFDEGMMLDRNFDFDSPSQTALAFAKKHGFKWTDNLYWGDGEQVGDEPAVAAADTVLVIFHTYCAGGFGDDVPKYIKKRGGAVVSDGDDGAPSISVVFRLPPKPKALRDELTKVFAQRKEKPSLSAWRTKPPWMGKKDFLRGASDDTTMFCDGKSLGFHMPIDPKYVEPLKKYLETNGVTSPRIRLCEEDDLIKFETIARATCDACGHSPLEYLEAGGGEKGLESDQLACTKCGGMFELENVQLPAPKKTKTVAKKKTTKKKTNKK